MKKYQVFISSTYTDLKPERQLIANTLLSHNCIPVGMEFFPSNDESMYDYIKKVIDESDIYVLIVGDRYGAISQNSNISYIELEYSYACSINKPTLIFIKIGDEPPSQDIRLHEFKKSLLNSRVVNFFASLNELESSLSRNIYYLLKNHPISGWIKAPQDNIEHGDNAHTNFDNYKEIKDEFYNINKKIDDLIFLQKSQEEKLHPVREKLQVFIGSSIEGLEVARCIQSELTYDYEIEIWNQGTVFGLGDSTLEALENAVKRYDIGIFVFTPDDELITRGESKPIARDNVVFELGLFIGKLTRFRAFVVHPQGKRISIPTDLAGITTATYNSESSNLRAALGPACHSIRDAIRRINK